MSEGMIRRLFWVDTRDMLADGLTKGGIDRTLLHSVSNDCRYRAQHECVVHTKFSIGGYGGGSATKGDPPDEVDPE